MFRLLRLAAYSLLGYVLYELIVGITEAPANTPAQSSNADEEGEKPAAAAKPRGRQNGRRSALTGEGAGRRVETADSDGASVPHVVGRGVTKRSV